MSVPTVAETGGDPADTSPDPTYAAIERIRELLDSRLLSATELMEGDQRGHRSVGSVMSDHGLLDIPIEEVRLGDHTAEGRKIIRLYWEREPERFEVTTALPRTVRLEDGALDIRNEQIGTAWFEPGETIRVLRAPGPAKPSATCLLPAPKETQCPNP